ncbi:V-type proton ATPase 116 kDa subunit a 1-like [Ptychodera flava]|uniref:V-type proton ATPase 116 kDa subunit a 1-like n=1 Tax=Ptychodera flava TaxID=63121 RepID=UPI00396A6DAB
MGSLFRSEQMTLAQLFLQSEAAYACVSELGELGVVQFRDLNPDVNAFQRKFVNEVRRCDEMERKLRFLETEIKKAEISITETEDYPRAPPPREMIDLEVKFEKLENEMKEVLVNQVTLKKNFQELTELKHVLVKTRHFFREVEVQSQKMQTGMEEGLRADTIGLGIIAGVVEQKKFPSFERMLWRVCHGKAFLRHADIETPLEDPVTGYHVKKSVFVIFFQGSQLKTRVKRICEGFHANIYPSPESQTECQEMIEGVNTRLQDLQSVLNQTEDHRYRALQLAAKNIKTWFIKVCKIKAIYHTLNLFDLDVTRNCLIAECWCPVVDLDQIQQALSLGTERSESTVPSILHIVETDHSHPTYNRTNQFTKAYQAIVNAYGVANYREVNPAPYTIITFPFLFSVMFGDGGHGLVMALFGLWMCVYQKSLAASAGNNEMWGTIYAGRYVVLPMGLFSIYSGLIYNDFFSKSLNIFGSSFNVSGAEYSNETIRHNEFLQLAPESTFSGSPYPLGFDPVWRLASNELTFTNSFKMKLSVIFGVIHMMFGVFLSLLNHVHFNKLLNIICEFIPQVLFLTSMFGYLVIMIFIKWFIFSAANSDKAPSLLITIINMFLFKPPPEQLYAGQQIVQTVLVVIVILCVPWMLAIKPLVLLSQSRKRVVRKPNYQALVNENEEDSTMVEPASDSDKNQDFDFSDVFIRQAIHTIEYCLGCISNTASYLRLWALSLAHAELSAVLWRMVLRIGLKMDSYIGSVVLVGVFAFWAVLTIAILLIMEGLSAFLHALRLHWVEFQNKFYTGDGHLFMPFSFRAILEAREE